MSPVVAGQLPALPGYSGIPPTTERVYPVGKLNNALLATNAASKSTNSLKRPSGV